MNEIKTKKEGFCATSEDSDSPPAETRGVRVIRFKNSHSSVLHRLIALRCPQMWRGLKEPHTPWSGETVPPCLLNLLTANAKKDLT